MLAQDQKPAITLSYYSPFGNQFGSRVGTNFQFKKDGQERDEHTSHGSIFLHPQVGFFIHPSVSQNYLINTDLGFKRSFSGRQIYFASSIGLGYLLSSEIVGVSVDLGSGELVREKENRSSLLPTFTIELGSGKQRRLTFYYRLFYGRRIAFGDENSSFFGLEVGTRFLMHAQNDQ